MGCHFLSSGFCWDRTALVAKSELSASTLYGLELSGRARIGTEVIQVLRVSNANLSSSVHLKMDLALVKLNSGQC